MLKADLTHCILAQENETKSIIRSLLASTPLKSTINTLMKDFVDTVGYELPFRQLGFANPEQYLRSIPDVVQVCRYLLVRKPLLRM